MSKSFRNTECIKAMIFLSLQSEQGNKTHSSHTWHCRILTARRWSILRPPPAPLPHTHPRLHPSFLLAQSALLCPDCSRSSPCSPSPATLLPPTPVFSWRESALLGPSFLEQSAAPFPLAPVWAAVPNLWHLGMETMTGTQSWLKDLHGQDRTCSFWKAASVFCTSKLWPWNIPAKTLKLTLGRCFRCCI